MPRPRHRYERVARKPPLDTSKIASPGKRPSVSVCSRRNVFFFENLGSARRARDAARRRETPSDSSGYVLGDAHASLTPRFLYFPPRSSHTPRPQTRSLIKKKFQKKKKTQTPRSARAAATSSSRRRWRRRRRRRRSSPRTRGQRLRTRTRSRRTTPRRRARW